jgi:uncharacterized protein (UPF0264 family)
MTKLLVSVKSVAEAEVALSGGASIIDVKEPEHGSLGRADDQVISEIVTLVGRSRLVSAALGELLDEPRPPNVSTLDYAKWGLAGASKLPHWRQLIAQAKEELAEAIPRCRLVIVAYADFERAGSPAPEEAIEVARELKCPAVLIDTWNKDGTNLLHWLSAERIASLCISCRQRGLQIALAGSLGAKEIELLLPASADWFAVRGAVCVQGRRNSSIDGDEVKRLVDLLAKAEQGGSCEN